jgi:hypothetical protein
MRHWPEWYQLIEQSKQSVEGKINRITENSDYRWERGLEEFWQKLSPEQTGDIASNFNTVFSNEMTKNGIDFSAALQSKAKKPVWEIA